MKRSPLFFVTPVLLLLMASLPAGACSCTNDYVPLEKRICELQQAGGVAVEVTLHRQKDGFGVVSLDDAAQGRTQRRVLNYGSSASCGYSLKDDRVGQRYLLLIDSFQLSRDTISLFECFYRSNIYRLSSRGDRIDYEYASSADPERRVGLKLQFYPGLPSINCPNEHQPRTTIEPSPLGDIGIAGNPGDGRLRLVEASGVMPQLLSLRVTGADGRRCAELNLAGYREGDPLDLTGLPPGFYHISVYSETHYRTLAYLKVR